MDYLEKLKAYNAMETIKDIPPWLQPLSLLMLGGSDPGGNIMPLATALAKHGVPVQELLPCIMDIFEVFLMNDKEDKEND